MTDFPSSRDVLAAVTPRDPYTIFALRSAEKGLTESAGRKYPNPDAVTDLAYAVLGWRRFVKRVVRGYRGHIEDYMNELASRSTIDEIVTLMSDDASSDFGAAVRVLVARIDRRFRKSTDLLVKPVWIVSEGKKDLDAYYRIPRPLLEPLRADLVSRGFVSADRS